MPDFDHVAILVRDLSAARAYWTDVVGMPVAREPDMSAFGLEGVFLGTGRGQIELYTILDQERLDAELGGAETRLDHVALLTEDLDGAVAGLRAEGATLVHPSTGAPLDGPTELGGAHHVWTNPASTRGVKLQVTQP
jgi:catechol 2,3-dioxygenase-like lactoylglutathione lyase family enzyme